jgi:hypothetical protein
MRLLPTQVLCQGLSFLAMTESKPVGVSSLSSFDTADPLVPLSNLPLVEKILILILLLHLVIGRSGTLQSKT